MTGINKRTRTMCQSLLVLLGVIVVGPTMGVWQDGVDIKSTFNKDELELLGNFEGHPEDHLRLLKSSRNSLFIGGRDAFFTFNTDSQNYNNNNGNDLSNYSTVEWPVPEKYQESCLFKGQSESKCHNFIRVFHGPLSPSSSSLHPKALALTSTSNGGSSSGGQYLVCGTNGFKPTCRWYSQSSSGWTMGREFSGVGYAPFDPSHMSTSLLHHDSVYAATVADFGATDALIYKQPLRTEQYSTLHLNSPSWVSSLSYGDLALFFFREAAVEHSNCGKAVFSRVARICRHDNGSKRHDRFTTFLKARLNCSVPGNIPFYFDYIQGTSDIVMNNERREEMLYAVFTTAENSIRASAVCSFSTKDILRAFDGPFKGQKGSDGNWLPVSENEVPSPRPGVCSKDPSLQVDSASAAFLKGHPLMDIPVQGLPLLTMAHLKDTFSAIEVDTSSIIAPYHVLYIGTDSGKVLKAVVNASSGTEALSLDSFSESSSVISQSWEVFPGQGIKSLKIIQGGRLVVLTETQMRTIRVDNCGKFSSCHQCLSIRDPHCGWDGVGLQCVAKNPPSILDKRKDEQFIQDVAGNAIHLCPIEDTRRNEILEANHLKSVQEQDQEVISSRSDIGSGGECCSCTSTTSSVTDKPSDKKNDDNILLLQEPEIQIVPQIQYTKRNESFLENEIPRFGDALKKNRNNNNQDYSSSFVRSGGENAVSTQSLALATTSSAVLSLLVGFSLGFLVAKWVAGRGEKSQKPSTNKLTANINESQRLTKPIDFVVNVPKTPTTNPLKNNLNSTDTLEKTVKKIYL